jgi:hypothetical protein
MRRTRRKIEAALKAKIAPLNSLLASFALARSSRISLLSNRSRALVRWIGYKTK